MIPRTTKPRTARKRSVLKHHRVFHASKAFEVIEVKREK